MVDVVRDAEVAARPVALDVELLRVVHPVRAGTEADIGAGHRLRARHRGQRQHRRGQQSLFHRHLNNLHPNDTKSCREVQ